ncbi:MAG: nucleotidyltransferase domain-containing protein [Magnetococcales bacterium]|nr:nucleotidyltransferase domain-containing protein [Magnetococcales bacterium]NGZ26489.1 nucleotidyltransferase domain-containing protein [Magnetococcales bacterium]
MTGPLMELAGVLLERGERVLQPALTRLRKILREVVPTSVGACLGGSVADGLFFPDSDLDLYLVGDPDGELARQLEQVWEEEGGMPPLQVTSFGESVLEHPDPWLRHVIWLHGSKVEMNRLLSVLAVPQVYLDHALEAALERKALLQRQWSLGSGRLRTHPNGLRAAWSARFLAATLRDRKSWRNALLGLKTLHWCDKLAGYSSWMPEWTAWFFQGGGAFSPPSPGREEMVCPMMRVCGRLLEKQLTRSTKGADPGGWLRWNLAWWGRKDGFPPELPTVAAEDALVAMGLAFNRETPPAWLPDLLTLARDRPLMRRRLYTHTRLLELEPSLRDRFWEQASAIEMVPRLQRLMESQRRILP